MNCFKKLLTAVSATVLLLPFTAAVNAHPHVFVEASMEVVRNKEGAFSELRHVWRFDELFSSTLILDFDENANGVLDEDEIKTITSTVIESIAEYDYYTAIRLGEEVIEFYPPESLKGYMEDGQMIMFLAVEPAKKIQLEDKPLRISASDTSYYVAFEFQQKNIKVSGHQADTCKTDVTIPDFDALYADNSQTLSDSFFDEENPDATLSLGDEFYSWAEIKC